MGPRGGVQIAVTEDEELMAWWEEVRFKGHPDKTEGWPQLKDVASLRDILTTVMWISSAEHAAINFGQCGPLAPLHPPGFPLLLLPLGLPPSSSSSSHLLSSLLPPSRQWLEKEGRTLDKVAPPQVLGPAPSALLSVR